MKFKLVAICLICSFLLFNCSSSKSLTQSQSSVIIHLKDGNKKEGLVIKRDGENLLYMDAKTHGKESVSISNIQRLSKAAVIYDFEAYSIPNSAINSEKGWNNTLLYGGGGLVLGTAVGFGAGLIAFEASGERSTLTISMAAFALAGGIYFGMVGMDDDYDEAIFSVRQKRYEISKQKRDKEIDEAKRDLQESQKKKLDLKKKIEDKKKE